MNVVLRRCPDCGGPLLRRRGLSWMACGDCPLALDPFTSPPDRLTTYRPEKETGESALRLTFYLFDLGEPGKAASIWIPAFRSSGKGAHKAGVTLTERLYFPPLVAAPLGAGLARTPAEATALLRLRHPSRNGGKAEIPLPRLASLPFQLLKGRLVEPSSGASFQPRELGGPP